MLGGCCRYTGIIQCARTIVRTEGVAGLYMGAHTTAARAAAPLRRCVCSRSCSAAPLALLSRRATCAGLVPNLAGIIPEKALKLGINDILRELYADDNGDVSLARGILIGACAGLGQCIATNPMEIVKIRGQTAALNGEAFNMAETVREMGLRGLYRGAASTLFRDIPFSAAFFASYGVLKDECAAPCPPLALPSAPVLPTSFVCRLSSVRSRSLSGSDGRPRGGELSGGRRTRRQAR